jgi:hemolysin D
MVRVKLKTEALSADNVKLPLSPGMTVVAEIKTGKRTVLSYVLDPVIQVSKEGRRER